MQLFPFLAYTHLPESQIQPYRLIFRRIFLLSLHKGADGYVRHRLPGYLNCLLYLLSLIILLFYRVFFFHSFLCGFSSFSIEILNSYYLVNT